MVKKNFVINRFSNKFYEKIISRPTKSREKLKEPILANLEKRLDIYITHEWNIRLLNSYLHDMIEGDLELPGFLEGFFD